MRLKNLVERTKVLGQIQYGGRTGKQGLDSMFVLRTIIEKSAGSGKTAERDLSLAFVDLSKAFDKVPHDLLWEKLLKMGCHPNFVWVLQALYKDSHVRVLVNGHQTDKIFVKSGVKQGCPLSPLLFTLFISDIAHSLEKSPFGVNIYGKIISALLFMDDLVLVTRNNAYTKDLLRKCQYQFELNGLEINCSKSNIITKEQIENDGISLFTSSGDLHGDVKLKDKYKYLGVTMGLGRACDIFNFQRSLILSRMKSYAGMVLSMAKESCAPVEVGEALWKSVALESVLYGIQVVSLTRKIMSELDSIQGRFAADLIGVSRSSSHIGILRELGWCSVSILVKKRKLLFWARLAGLKEDTWTSKALKECMSACYPHEGAWKSSFRQETQEIFIESKIGNVLKDNRKPEANIRLAMDKLEKTTTINLLKEHRKRSLKYFPDYPDGMGRQKYLDRTDESSTLAKYRLGNAGLGNRNNPPVLICPGCLNGPNNELHLVFECQAMNHLRESMAHILEEAPEQKKFRNNDPKKLQSFLGGDFAPAKILKKRGTFLSILSQKLMELSNERKVP